MELILRKEIPDDYSEVEDIIEQAFKSESINEPTEHILVRKLRDSSAFIPELSIVAEVDKKIVGHIILSKIKINNNKNSFDSLALAPVSVLPSNQNRGVGAQLIYESHRMAKKLGYKSIVLLGHENYYPKFGYKLTKEYGITLPFEAPDENCMVIELVEGGLEGVNGIVEYSSAFNEL